jgi:hypothetical protein
MQTVPQNQDSGRQESDVGNRTDPILAIADPSLANLHDAIAVAVVPGVARPAWCVAAAVPTWAQIAFAAVVAAEFRRLAAAVVDPDQYSSHALCEGGFHSSCWCQAHLDRSPTQCI